MKHIEVIYSYHEYLLGVCHSSRHWGNNGGKRKLLLHGT